ncbi:MAG: hypothetical protein ACYTGC_03970 [Planctomycetota bacterium]|jgi:hypothetical protein
MEFLTELWLPIVLSAVFVFILSSVFHIALPTHRSDYKKMKNEDAVLEALRSNGVEPGCYMFPNAGSMKEAGTPEMQEKLKTGPVGLLTVVPPGRFNMGKNLALWFGYSLLVSVLVAYVGWYGLGVHAPVGMDYLDVFRVTGPAAILGYAVGYLHDSIWKGGSWVTTSKFIFDGVMYGLLTAGTFGWLWPEAAV